MENKKQEDMNLSIKLLLFILCLNLTAQIGKAERLYPPPVERVKPPVDKKKKKKKIKKRSKKNFLFRNSFKKEKHPQSNTLESQQADWYAHR